MAAQSRLPADSLTFTDFWSRLECRSGPLFLCPNEGTDGPAFERACLALATVISMRGWQTVGLHTCDSLAFATGLFGALLAGAMPEVLPHTQPGFVAQLNGNLDGIVTDHSLSASGIPSVEIGATSNGPIRANFRWPDGPRISFRTSGSSGAPKRVVKSLGAIEAELAAFEVQFGLEVPGLFAGTVDHQHYYGATVRILWPLLAGRCVVRRLMRYPSDVMNVAAQSVAVVTSPTFLVSALDLLSPQRLSKAHCRLFSAGAPLPHEAAERLNAGDDWLVAEIFGSTESGAICSRVRRPLEGDVDAWTPLPGVRLSVDGARILATWSRATDSAAVELDDRAERLADGRLRFLGRRDRIVKVREKRVSLVALEAELGGDPYVREVAAVELQRHRLTDLGVVVAPTDTGFAALESKGHRAMVEILQGRLRHLLDPTTLPKKWRFVRALPRNCMAKVTSASLVELFVDPGQIADAFPEILADFSDELSRTVDMRIGAELRWFRGHFPSVPVLPGVVQIEWAAHFGAELTTDAGRFGRLQRVKFSHAMQPGLVVRLALRYDVDKRSLSFAFSNPERTFSSGRFVYV